MPPSPNRTRSKLKKTRAKRSATSTTLQFAPPGWLVRPFEKFWNGSGNIALPLDSHPGRQRPRGLVARVAAIPYLLAKLLFINLYMGMGAAVPFLPIFYNETLKLSSSQIGVVFFLAPFIAALSCPLWTGLADRFQAHRSIMVFTYTMATVSVAGQMLLPTYVDDAASESASGFMMMWVLVAASWFAFFGIPVNALVDSGVLKILGDKKELYGEQRLWGSVAYGLSTLLVGIMINATQSQSPIFIMFFVSAALLIINAAATDFSHATDTSKALPMTRHKNVAFKSLIDVDDDDNNNQRGGSSSRAKHRDDASSTIYLTSQPESDDSSSDEGGDEEEDEDGISVPDLDLLAFPPAVPTITLKTIRPKSDFLVLVTKPSVMTLLITMLLMGTALAMCNSFLLIFLTRDLKANSMVVGLTGPMSALTELLFFFYSKELLSRLGIIQLTTLAHLMTIVRAVTFMFLKANVFSHVMALLAQLLNGAAYSALWSSGVNRLTSLAPQHLASFSQGLMTAVFIGVGTGIGSLSGGIIYQHLGPQTMFAAVAIVTSISLVTYCYGEGVKLAGFHSRTFDAPRENGQWLFLSGSADDLTQTVAEGSSVLSVETVHNATPSKKNRWHEEDDDTFWYGVFGEENSSK